MANPAATAADAASVSAAVADHFDAVEDCFWGLHMWPQSGLTMHILLGCSLQLQNILLQDRQACTQLQLLEKGLEQRAVEEEEDDSYDDDED